VHNARHASLRQYNRVLAQRGRVPLGLRDERVEVGDHIAYFWENEAEFRDGVRFLEVGLDAGDFCVIFGHVEGNARVRQTLQARGYDLPRLEAAQQLVAIGGEADADRMLSNIGGVFAEAVQRGATLIRLLGNIGWGHHGWPDERSILEFESKVTDAAKLFPSVVVCMYDVQKLPGRIILKGAFQTHPLTIIGNITRQNPQFVSFDEFMQQLRSKALSS
jgi:hypothetical protein